MTDRGTEFLLTVPLTVSASVVFASEHHYVVKFEVLTVIISDNDQEFNSHRFELFFKT